HLYPFWHFQFRSISLERIAARRRNCTSKDELPWTRNIAALDRLLNAHVAIARTLSLDIAQCGEALLQCTTRRDRSPRRTEGQWILQDVGVIPALRWVFTLQKNMGVGIDQSWQHGGVGEIDHSGVGRYFRACG